MGGADGGAVGIAGGGVGQPVLQQPQGGILCPAAQTAQNAALVQLDDNAPPEPALKPRGVALDGIVPLRMGGHGNQAPVADVPEALLHKLRGLVKIKFHQQIPAPAQGLELPLVQQPGQLRSAEHLGPRVNAQGDALRVQGLLQPGEGRTQGGGAVILGPVPRQIAMGRGDDVRDAGIRRHPGHLQRVLHGRGPIVHPRQNVTMDIHHIRSLPSCESMIREIIIKYSTFPPGFQVEEGRIPSEAHCAFSLLTKAITSANIRNYRVPHKFIPYQEWLRDRPDETTATCKARCQIRRMLSAEVISPRSSFDR